MSRLHPKLASLPKVTRTPYRIKRGDRGYTVWKFRGWGQGGWAIIKQNLTQDEAHQFVLRRHGLETAEPEPDERQVFTIYGFWGV